jgi:hypothetical protein
MKQANNNNSNGNAGDNADANRDDENSRNDIILAYHMGQLSNEQRLAFEKALTSDPELKTASDMMTLSLSHLDNYEVEIPAGLQAKLKFNAHAQPLTTHELIENYTNATPSHKPRLLFSKLADLIATAASIALICSAIMLSTGHARKQARKAMCAGNLGSLGSALTSYSNDYYNQLPQANLASNLAWYDAAQKTPKRANLYILVKYNYTSPELLICPEDHSKSLPIKNLAKLFDFPINSVVSYSFQNLNGDKKFTSKQLQQRWQRAQSMPIMADRTPLMRGNRLQRKVSLDQTVSRNHNSLKGQNVLILDGRVVWQTTPLFGPEKDNIWQAGQIKEYQGKETPVNSTDSFLAP